MLEVQALVARTHFGFPKRMVTGLDYNRTLLLIAVLEKRLGLHLENEDVYVNVVGGLRVKEPAVDLGVAMAIASAHRNQTLDPHTVWIGEVGLGRRSSFGGSLASAAVGSVAVGFQTGGRPEAKLAGCRSRATDHETGNSWYFNDAGSARSASLIIRKAVYIMTLWFFRILAIVVGPVIGWYEISNDWKGILIGVGAALFIIGVEIIIERVPLDHLLFGVIGAGLGFVIAFCVVHQRAITLGE